MSSTHHLRSRARVALGVFAFVLTLVLAAAAFGAATADANLKASIQYLPTEQGLPKTVGAGLPARFSVGAFNQGPGDATSVVLTIHRPAESRILAADSACTGSNPLVCRVPAIPPNAVGGVRLDLASDTPGPLTLHVTVASDNDPDASDNAFEQTITVLAPETSGSGAGTVAEVSALHVAGFARMPSRPSAGRRLVAVLRLGGAPRPRGGAVTCRATVRGTSLAPVVRRYRTGTITCAWLVPMAAKGGRLTATVSFRSGGRTFQRSFDARVR